MSSGFQSGLRVRPNSGLGQYSYALVPPSPEPRLEAGPAARDSQRIRCEPGPWGDIEYRFIYIEASDHVIERMSLPTPVTRWTFPGLNAAAACSLLDRCGVPREWIAIWKANGALIEQDALTHVLPWNSHVEELNPEVRGRIYRELAKYPANEFQADPVIIAGGSVPDFLRNTGIRKDLARRFEKMCYLRGPVLCFSDLQALIACAADVSEARRLYKLFTRTRAIIAYLNVTPSTDIAALADYWTAWHRRKDILPMLQSLAETPSSLDLIHILPPLPRKCLNSYPPLEMGIQGRQPDCHWTALNFFNYEPQEVYRDTRLASSFVNECFEEVEQPYRYGDVLLFVSDDGREGVHSCVFIADEIVFTKNGESVTMPWMLSRLQDLKEIYQVGNGIRIKAVRRKVVA